MDWEGKILVSGQVFVNNSDLNMDFERKYDSSYAETVTLDQNGKTEWIKPYDPIFSTRGPNK